MNIENSCSDDEIFKMGYGRVSPYLEVPVERQISPSFMPDEEPPEVFVIEEKFEGMNLSSRALADRKMRRIQKIDVDIIVIIGKLAEARDRNDYRIIKYYSHLLSTLSLEKDRLLEDLDGDDGWR